MPYHLELGSDGHAFKGKAIVVNSMTGVHHSKSPIPIERAKEQMRVLEAQEMDSDYEPEDEGAKRLYTAVKKGFLNPKDPHNKKILKKRVEEGKIKAVELEKAEQLHKEKKAIREALAAEKAQAVGGY